MKVVEVVNIARQFPDFDEELLQKTLSGLNGDYNNGRDVYFGNLSVGRREIIPGKSQYEAILLFSIDPGKEFVSSLRVASCDFYGPLMEDFVWGPYIAALLQKHGVEAVPTSENMFAGEPVPPYCFQRDVDPIVADGLNATITAVLSAEQQLYGARNKLVHMLEDI